MATHDPYADQVRQAYELLQQGEREQALAILYSVVTTAPRHRNAWWLIVRAATTTQQKEQALKRVLEIDPQYGPALELRARLSQMNVPTDPGPTADSAAESYAAAESYPPPAAPAAPPSRPPDYAAPPRPAYEYNAYEDEPPSRPRQEPREPEVRYVTRTQLQPFLILNGGLTSGCFASVLTLIALAVLGFLLLGDAISQALRDVGALAAGEGVTASFLPAIAITAVLAVLRSNPGLIPINLGILGAQGTGAEVYANALRGFWESMGYPATTGDIVLGRIGGVGSQLSTLNWLIPVIFLVAWIGLAFLLVFLRARSGRFLHWFLSTVGLWILLGLACGLGTVLYRLVGGGVP